MIKVGDAVYYWTRRKGEPARMIYGVVRRLNETGTFASVEGHDTCIQVHTIAVSRLKPAAQTLRERT